MDKIKVIQVLLSLNPSEWRQLDKFVRSPIHNQHEGVVLLFKYLRKHLPDQLQKLSPEKIFHHLFPEEPMNLPKLHHLSSYLLRVTESFLAWNEWQNQRRQESFYLLQALHGHQQLHLFDRCLDSIVTERDQTKVKDVAFLREGYEIESVRFAHDRSMSDSRGFRLQELSDSLDMAYVAEKLKTSCILLSNQTVVKTQYDTGLLQQLLVFLEGHPFLEIPAISVYYFACKTLSDFNDDTSFQHLKDQLSRYSHHFHPAELYDLYIFAINYCIRRSNKGAREFVKEIFGLYKTGMESEVFVQQGIIPPRTYSNIVMSGLRMQAYEWIEEFIHRYKAALPEKQREGFYNYNLARLHFQRKEYDKAMPLLLQMEYDDVLLNCLGKIMLTQMYYDQGETEALLSLLQSFKTYIRRKKMLGYHRESYLNFILFVNRIISGEHPDKVLSAINQTDVVAEREWLRRTCQS